MAAITIPELGAVSKGLTDFTVAKYTMTNGANKYSERMKLCAAATLGFSADSASDSEAEFENGDANESAPSIFNGGTLTLSVKGLSPAAAKFIYGLGTPDTSGWTDYDDTCQPPEVGFGFVKTVQYDGITAYQPIVLYRVVFQTEDMDFETLKKTINFKSQELKATVMRDLTPNHAWKSAGNYYATRSEAVTALNTKLGTA